MFTEHDEPEAYDQAITIFSPQGRLLQVEYAFEAVNRGATVIGITCKEGVVLGAEESENGLLDPNFTRKIFEVDEHVGAVVAGLAADANVLIEQARIRAQTERLTYGEPASIEILAKKIADIKQMYTQYAGVRPFGVSIIFGGVDKSGNKIFVTDPSGSCKSYKAVVLGVGRETIENILKDEYEENLRLEAATKLAAKCLVASLRARKEKPEVKIAVIPSQTRRFKVLTREERAIHIRKM